MNVNRYVYRDIGGSDPERTAPPKVADYVTTLFAHTPCVKVNILADLNHLEREYPMLVAVNRACQSQYFHISDMKNGAK